MNLMHERIGSEFAPFIHTRYETINGGTICVVDVDHAPQPAFMLGPHDKEFYVRQGNTSRSLDPEATVRFIQMHWE